MVKFEVGSIYKGFEVYEMEVDKLYKSDCTKYHKVSQLKVYGSEKERVAMKIDMLKNGQTDPIALYKKRGSLNVVDGRNRLSALKMAGIKMVKCFYLPSNYTLKQLEGYVMNSRIRVNSTKAQLAIESLRLSENSSMTQEEAAKTIGVSRAYVEQASSIKKILPKALDSIWNSGKWTRIDGKPTTSLSGVLADVKLRTETKPNSGTGEPMMSTDEALSTMMTEIVELRKSNRKSHDRLDEAFNTIDKLMDELNAMGKPIKQLTTVSDNNEPEITGENVFKKELA